MRTIKSLDEQINQYLVHLNVKQKKAVLNLVKVIVQKERDWWDEIEDNAKESIDRALTEMKAGKLTPHNEVMKKYKKWLPN